jgi:hypothetical protein
MRFDVEHSFAATPHAVADLLVDADFYGTVELPDLALREVVTSEPSGERATLALRYEYVGSLDPVARKLLGGRVLTWLQTLTIDRAPGRGRLTIAADGAADLLRADASVVLRAAENGTTVRRIDGEFVVRVPLVGGAAERRILPGVLRRLDVEADALRARLRERA